MWKSTYFLLVSMGVYMFSAFDNNNNMGHLNEWTAFTEFLAEFEKKYEFGLPYSVPT